MKDLMIDKDNDGDLLIRNGDFVIGEQSSEIIERILLAYPGEFKAKPELGCHIAAQINGKPSPFWRGEATAQLQAEGLSVKRLDLLPTGIEIELM